MKNIFNRNLFFISFLFIILIITNSYAGVDFDTTDDRLTCGNNSSILTENGAMSIALWIFPRIGGNVNARIVGRGLSNLGRELRFTWKDINTLNFSVNTSGTTLDREASDNSLTLNVWQHIGMTWDGSLTAANVKFYVNGIETSYKTTQDGTGTPNDNSADDIYIGNRNLTPEPDRGIDSIMSDIVIWGAVNTSDNMLQLASSKVKRIPLQVNPSNLQAYWALDDEPDGTSVDGNTFIDLTGNGNTCTGNNGANNTGLLAKAEEVLTY